MSYIVNEQSLELGKPVELYEFVQGLTVWAYATSAEEQIRQGRVYKPSPILRDRVKQQPDHSKNDLKITLPREDSFSSQFLGFAPDEVTTLTIYRGHVGDNDFITYWKGRVIGASVSGNSVVINCESVFTSIARAGLRARFEYTCRHALYGVHCRVSAAQFEVPGTVASISSNGLIVTVPAAAGKTDGYFTGGILAYVGQRRFITKHTGSDITVARPIFQMTGGAAVNLYPGCDHTLQTCINKFDNVDNNGSFPWIPVRNPFDGSSVF